MTRLSPALLLLALGPAGHIEGAPPVDAVAELLARGGLSPEELSRLTPADEPGAPRVDRLPFALPHLLPVLARPPRLPLLAGSLRSSAERLGSDPALLFFKLGLETRFPGFGSASAGLPGEYDLARALDLLRCPLDAPPPYGGSFGSVRPAGDAPPSPSERSRREAVLLPAPLRAPLARFVAALAQADAFVRLAWRRVPPTVAASAAARRDLLADLPDGAVFPADIADAARLLDAESLAFAARIALDAASRAAVELVQAARALPPESAAALRWEVETPRGRLRVAGTRADRVAAAAPRDGYLLLVDLGGDDAYEGALASAEWPARPLSVVLDLAGDDAYTAPAGVAAQGSGCGGVGLLLDAAGRDRYGAGERSQAYAQLGAGLLVDLSGDDVYELGAEGQGAAVFGTALLLDRAGDDRYRILRDGQGYGGPGGAGLLVDGAGADSYAAERDPAIAGRPDPRADGKASTSNAQGIGVGRRGDGSDGHSWPGGLGALLDLGGDDTYVAGTWAQGAGYFLGTGLLVDAAGNDRYESVWYAQGSAAHRGLGLLLDEAGDDLHVLSGTGGAGLGFGWDFGVGILLDRGGNDTYRARRLALGAALRRSVGLFVEEAGDDRYELENPAEGFGSVDDDPAWAERDPIQPVWNGASQAGLFLDLGGRDVYPRGAFAGERRSWGTWEEGRTPKAPRNLGAGADRETGALPVELAPRN